MSELTDSQRGGVIAVRVPSTLDAAIKRVAAEELISKSAFCRRAVLQMLQARSNLVEGAAA